MAGEPKAWRGHVAAVARRLADMLIERELALAEINPLFVSAAGCIAGDAKLVVDLGAVERQPRIAALIEARPQTYPDANRKLAEGFDYVDIDPEGEIGLVTTGAGLSMMLIDELTARGMKPLNFCDIRTGQMRGSPARVMRVLEWITAHQSLRAVLVSVFAGITDLAEFADLLATGMERTPSLRVPVVARLVGRGAAEARRILAERQPDVFVTEDLEEAMERVGAVVGVGSLPPTPSREGRGRSAKHTAPPPLAGGSWGSRFAVGNHTRHRAGHHRPHGPDPCGIDARLRHQHRGRHIRALGREGSSRRACVRQLPRRRGSDWRVGVGRHGTATGDACRGRGSARRRHPGHRDCGRGHSAARRHSHRPRSPPRRRHLDRRLHAWHGNPRRNQTRVHP